MATAPSRWKAQMIWLGGAVLLVSINACTAQIDRDDPWFNNRVLPDVDLEGLIANLSEEISWFHFVGNVTLTCADLAKKEDTLMYAVEALHGCLSEAYQKCASEYAEEGGCKSPFISIGTDACGSLRLGDPVKMFYGENMHCFWHLQVPEQWIMNLTIDQFDMEYGSMECPYDYAMVYDGNTTDAKAYGKFCGRIPKFTIYGTTNLMLMTAHTDESVGKYGFRAVFQVMDPGLAYTNTLNEHYLRGEEGSFDLQETPFLFYEVWDMFRFYTRWHIRTDISKRLWLRIHYNLTESAEVSIYDGTSEMNPIVKRLNYTDGLGRTFTYEESAYHQLFIQVSRQNLTEEDAVTGSFRSLDVKPSFAELHNTHVCQGDTNIDLTDISAQIGVDQERLKLETLGVAIQCFWNITAPPGQYINLHFKVMEFNNYNTRDCQDEGLILIDGTSFREHKLRLGPYCYEDPRGLFSPMEGGVNDITSTGQHFFIAYYSFINYTLTSWTRGVFDAYVEATTCQGFFQPCTAPEGIVETSTYRAEKRIVGDKSEIDFYCEKGKCCVIQQLALYNNMTIPECRVAVLLKGSKISATSEFHSSLVMYQKNDTEMSYSCQLHDAIRNVSGGTPMSHMCLGTQVFIWYKSQTIWSMGSFHASVKEHECGIFEPDMHPSNELFLPCAEAHFPTRSGTFSVRFIDPFYVEDTYYSITLKYDNKDHKRKCKCFKERFEVRDVYTSYVWSEAKMPFEYKSWPSSSKEKGVNWTREVVVTRTAIYNETDADCSEEMQEKLCVLIVKIQNATEENPDRYFWYSPEVECKTGYEKIGLMCLKVYFPHADKPNPGLLPIEYNLTSNQAEQLCQQEDEGGHLADMDNAESLKTIRWHMFYNWWQKYLKYIPGMLIFHVGLNDIKEKDIYYWNEGRKAYDFHYHWHIPNPYFRYPDLTTRPTPSGAREDIPLLRPKYLREAVKTFHPNYNQNASCTILLYFSPHHDAGTLLKVPCDMEIPGAMALCRTPPSEIPEILTKRIVYNTENITSLKSLLSQETDGLRSQLFTEIIPTPKGNMLHAATKQCPEDYMLIWKTCYFMKSMKKTGKAYDPQNEVSERRNIDKEEVVAECRKQGGRIAVIEEKHIQTLLYYVRIWRHQPGDGRIGFAYWTSRWKKDSDKARCHLFQPVLNNTYGISTYEWQLNQGDCSKYRGVSAFLCEMEPQPSGEICQKNHVKCADKTCILSHSWCDGINDCLDKSDEANCRHVCKAKPGHEFIPATSCFKDCHEDSCACSQLYFQCHSGGCVPASKICDQNRDCTDNSDEDICVLKPPECNPDEIECQPRECVSDTARCDGVWDCINGLDERNCESDPETKCPQNPAIRRGYFNCPGDEKCLPRRYHNDFIADCPNLHDEKTRTSFLKNHLKLQEDGAVSIGGTSRFDCSGLLTSCNNFLDLPCYRRNETCFRKVDVYGRHKQCRQGEHMLNCELVQCPGMFKCPDSYCIPFASLCDGQKDCENGEDEQHCTNLYCPNLLRCREGNKCLRASQICNKKYDCPFYKDDEQLCEMKVVGCPSWCSCLGDAADCSKRNESEDTLSKERGFSVSMKVLVLSHNKFTGIPDLSKTMPDLYRLDCSHNDIQVLQMRTFSKKFNLRELYLHNNGLSSLPQAYFVDLHNLEVLTLYNNKISHVDGGIFRGLKSLPVLDLSRQKLRSLEPFIFEGLDNVEVIDVSYNDIETVKNHSFSTKKKGKASPLETLRFLSIENNPLITEAAANAFKMLPPRMLLKTDKYKFCCYALQIKNCEPGPDEFSSCDDLMSSLLLRTVLWGVGLLAFIGNAVVVQQRIKHEKETTPSIMVQHLAVADFMMGFYLIIIGGADAHLRGRFNVHTDTWKAHAICRLAAFLYNLSSMMSPYIMLLTTADRMYATIPRCNAHGLNLRSGRALLALGWTVSVVMSVAPVLEFGYFGKAGYVRTGACIVFQLTEDSEEPAWQYGMAIFLWANAICIFFMGFGYIASIKAMKAGIQIFEHMLTDDMTEEEKEEERTFRQNEMVITRRLMIMVMSNFIIWVPLLFITGFSLLGFHVDQITAAWIALFVAPLNSALNPFLFTFSGKPYRGRVDELLANWVEQEYAEDEDEFAEAAGMTEAAKADSYQQAILREML